MSELAKIKLKLAKIVASFSELKTSNGILYWPSDEELAVGFDVYLLNEDGEYVEAPDGEYVDEDRVITVVEGKVASIETPVDVNVEINAEETIPEAIVEERKEVNELYEIVDNLVKELGSLKEEIAAIKEKIADFGKMSAAFSAEVEIENKDVKTNNKRFEAALEGIKAARN